MKAVGNNLIIKVKKEATTTTKGGLLLSEGQREDIRYRRAEVLSAGEAVEGIGRGDEIFYDKHAGSKVEVEGVVYHVIQAGNIVIVV